MIDESAAVLPIWMLLSAAFGFMIGDALGQNFARRKHLEEANADLRDELEKARAREEPLHRELKRQRGILHDIHRRISAVPKGSSQPPSTSHR